MMGQPWRSTFEQRDGIGGLVSVKQRIYWRGSSADFYRSGSHRTPARYKPAESWPTVAPTTNSVSRLLTSRSTAARCFSGLGAGNTSEYHGVANSHAASRIAFTHGAAQYLARRVQAVNDVAVLVQHLGTLVNIQTRTGLANHAGTNLSGVVRAMTHWKARFHLLENSPSQPLSQSLL